MFSVTSALDTVTLSRSRVGTSDSSNSCCAARHCLAVRCSGPSRRGGDSTHAMSESLFPITALLTAAFVDEWKTNLMSLAILFHLCAQHVSDINISIFRSLRLC